jgi:hypothetical protein
MKSVVRAIMAGMILCAVPAFAQTAGTADTNMEIFMQKIKRIRSCWSRATWG